MYWIIRSPRVMQKLREEIDSAVLANDSVLPVGDVVTAEDDELEGAVLWYDQVRDLVWPSLLIYLISLMCF